MPFVHSQPPQYYQLPSALIEANAKQVTSQHEWDTEWNNMGLPSRLTPEVVMLILVVVVMLNMMVVVVMILKMVMINVNNKLFKIYLQIKTFMVAISVILFS